MKFKPFFVLFLFLILLMSCESQKLNLSNTERQWMLIQFSGFKKEFLVQNKAELNLTHPDASSSYSAFMGCNRLFLTAKFTKNGKASFSQVGGTEMFCEENMDLEKNFMQSLSKMTEYKIEGHFLTLSDENGNQMKFVAADWD